MAKFQSFMSRALPIFYGLALVANSFFAIMLMLAMPDANPDNLTPAGAIGAIGGVCLVLSFLLYMTFRDHGWDEDNKGVVVAVQSVFWGAMLCAWCYYAPTVF